MSSSSYFAHSSSIFDLARAYHRLALGTSLPFRRAFRSWRLAHKHWPPAIACLESCIHIYLEPLAAVLHNTAAIGWDELAMS